MSIVNSHAYQNWHEYDCDLDHVKRTWNDEYKLFHWEDMLSINAVPVNDKWLDITVQSNNDYDQLLLSKGIDPNVTQHSMCLHPDLSAGLAEVVDKFSNFQHHYNFLKLKPGYTIPWHFDSYATFMRYNNIAAQEFANIRRTVIILEDWSPGQIIQIGNRVLSHWEAGACYTWKGDTWHGVANFGFDDFVCMQVTWLPFAGVDQW